MFNIIFVIIKSKPTVLNLPLMQEKERLLRNLYKKSVAPVKRTTGLLEKVIAFPSCNTNATDVFLVEGYDWDKGK